ncbi:MAG: hypothetical protein E7637_03450 [Ruminococcaceae bacterium]|nr:hypothetical protein [Oscillospiraceae bacterium]
MSESEKKKRGLYRKNREKWIFAQSVIVAVVAIAILISSLVSHQLSKKYYIGYKEGGNIDYDVYLKENDFYDSPYLDKNQSYVASLIDRIITNFSYEIDMDTANVNYRYSYTIKSRLEIIDDTSGAAIYNPEYELINVQNKLQNSSSRLTVNEIVVLKYDEYNDLANRFLDTYGLSATTSNIVLTLTVDVLSDCNAFSGSSVDTYSSELRIPLTTQTVNIQMTSSVPAAETKMIACTRGAGSEVFKTTAIVLGVIDALLILLLVAFIYLTRTPDITYTARVKKIMSQYKSYIQRIKNLFETNGYQVIVVDTFDEMLEIRDTIQAPILMYENEEKTCAKFMIPTDSKLLYLYTITMEGYVEPEVPQKEEAVPTMIVKPNITNLVRPVVKVVVTPPTPKPEPDPEPDPEPEIETVIEEAEVEIVAEDTEIPEVIATVEEAEPEAIAEEPVEEPEVIATVAELETEPENPEPLAEITEPEPEEKIDEILAAIPSADDELIAENMVEAIDIFWEERKNKIYRYDPDGNIVEQGDIVLVPTRDEASDKDIVREAEVSRGNYKVDAATLDRPLKKIIGVVKRKAEQIFTAMITPTEEKED